MEADLAKLEEYGLSTSAGLAFTGSSEKYKAAIQRYLKGHDANRKDIAELAETGDIENYRIKVHALKSNSRMIGASELAQKIEALEKAASDGDTAFINEQTASALEDYDRLVEFLAPVGQLGEVHPVDEINAEEARRISDELLTALDDFDDDLSKELAKKLSGYPFRITQKEKLREAIRYIEDFLYDDAAELIKEIVPAIV